MSKSKDKLPALPTKYDARTKHDWVAAREEYINGTLDTDGTLRYPKNAEISAKYGIPVTSLTNRISKERWSDHRQAHERTRLMKIQQERMKVLAHKAVIFDETAANVAQTAMKIILERLLEIDRVRQADKKRIAEILERMEAGEEVSREELRPLYAFSEISELSKAFANFHEGGRRALGIRDDETGATKTPSVTIEINTTLQSRLSDYDETRQAGLLSVLKNPNLVIPGVTDKIEDAEIVETEQIAITTGDEDD